MLFQRFVAEIEIDPSGRLQPRAASRSESARGEASIHRQVVKLVDATDRQIAAFASKHGLLRRAGGGVMGATGAEAATDLIASAFETLDEIDVLRTWLRAGRRGPVPPGAELTLALATILGGLPPEVVRAFDALATAGPADTSARPAAFYALAVPIFAAAAPLAKTYIVEPEHARLIGAQQLEQGFRLLEWFNRIAGGLDDQPGAIRDLGGVDALAISFGAYLPEVYLDPDILDGPDGPAMAYIRSLATETVGDWRVTAAEMRELCEAIDLARRSTSGQGLDANEIAELARRYAEAVGSPPLGRLTPAELGERLAPLTAESIRARLAVANAWPLRRGQPIGLYARCLVAALVDVTGTQPRLACTEPGCPGTYPPTRNRHLCDEHQAAHKRANTARSRAGTPDGLVSGSGGR